MRKILAVAALIISSPIFAQTDTLVTLNEVTITANKFGQKQTTTGKVVTVITKEQLEKKAGRTVAQVLNEQAGITINGALNNLGSNQTLYMRGAASGRTLILLNGIPVNDPSLINNEFDLNLISTNEVERIEICRGAQSTLYGSDAVAGVINIITLKNDVTKPFNIKAVGSVGNYHTYRGNVQAYGKVGKLTYTTRYAKLSSAGFSAAHDSTGKGDFDNDSYNSDVVSAGLNYQATEHLSFRTFGQYTRYKTELDATIFTDEWDYAVRNKSNIAGGGFRYTKGDVNVAGNYQYSDTYRNYLNDSLHRPGFAKFSTDDYYGKNQFVELYATVKLHKNITLLQGADYRFSGMNSQFLSLSSFGPFRTGFRDTTYSQASMYSSLFFNGLQEKLHVEFGGRLNVHSRYGSNATYTFNPSFSITNHFRIFGSIASGFKAPTLYQLYSSYGRPDLKAETSTTFEAGVQQQHATLQNRVVVFRRRSNNGIDFDNIRFLYFNYIKQTVNGLELESAWQPITGLSLTANYTYINPEERSQSRVTFADTTYNYLLRRPQHNFNVTAGYQVTPALFVSASGKYVGSRYDVGGYKKADVAMPDYFIVNAYAEYKLKPKIKFFADGQNLTNRRFFDIRGYNSIPFIFNAGVSLEL